MTSQWQVFSQCMQFQSLTSAFAYESHLAQEIFNQKKLCEGHQFTSFPTTSSPTQLQEKSELLMDLQATTLLFYKTKIHSSSKLPFTPAKTHHLSEVLSCDSNQEDATIEEYMLNDTMCEHHSWDFQFL